MRAKINCHDIAKKIWSEISENHMFSVSVEVTRPLAVYYCTLILEAHYGFQNYGRNMFSFEKMELSLYSNCLLRPSIRGFMSNQISRLGNNNAYYFSVSPTNHRVIREIIEAYEEYKLACDIYGIDHTDLTDDDRIILHLTKGIGNP